MTLREKLADWISGGMVTHWQDLASRNGYTADKALDGWRKACDDLRGSIAIANQYQNALQYIIDQDTPGANATVKRIVHVAKDALK